MDPSTLTTILTNSGMAGVVLLLVVFGYLVPKPTVDRIEAENKLLREDRDLQRQRADEVASTGSVTNQLISALVNTVAVKQDPAPAIDGRTAVRDPAGTWKDLA